MINRHEHSSLTWIDVVSPTSNEVHDLVEECGIPLVFATDLTTPIPKTEAHSTKRALKVTLDYPIVKRTDINHPHEIKFIATKDRLVTIRFEDIEALDRFAREFEVTSILRTGGKKLSGGNLLITLLKHLYAGLQSKLDYLESRLADIEEGIYSGKEKEMVIDISQVNRRLITFRQTIAAHEPVLEQLEAHMTTTFGKQAAALVPALQTEFDFLSRRLISLSRSLDELRETNNSLLTTKQNEIMKTFTILAFITFPLTLVSSLFGMNTETMPIQGPGDFWIVVSIMVVVSISFFAFFRYKKWM